MSDLEAWKRNPPSIVTSDSPAAEQDRIADLFGYPPESNPQTRLIDAFHERTQRCLGRGERGDAHLDCAMVEQRHREGRHGDCLPIEDATNPCGEQPLIEPFDLETQEGRIEALGHASRLRSQAISDLREADRLIERCWSAAEAALERHRSDWEIT